MACLWAVAWSLQESPNHWVERLRSEDAAVREEATRRLKELGAEATDALRAAAGDADPEVAARAQLLLRIVEIRARLPDAIRRALPEIEERMAAGEAHAWTQAFLAMDEDGKRLASRDDLEWMAPQAIRGVSDEEDDEGVCAIVAEYGIRSAAPDLVALLQGNPESSAARALMHLGDSEIVPALARGLATGGAEYIDSASDVLAAVESSEGVDLLVRRLDDPDVRWTAVDALVKLQAFEALIASLDHKDARVREEVLAALAPGDVSDTVVFERLSDADAGVRAAAAWLVHGEGAQESLTACLKDENAGVRAAAVQGIVDFDAVLGVLDDPDPSVRAAAAGTIAELDAARARPLLVARLDVEADEGARRALVAPLARMRSPEVIPDLVEAFERELARNVYDPGLLDLLAAYATPRALDPLVPLLDLENPRVRLAAARALGEARYRPAAERLVAHLAADDPELRRNALESFGWMKWPGAATSVAPLLRSDRAETVTAALRAYSRTGAAPPADELIRLAGHEDAGVRAEAAGGLGGVRTQEAVLALRELLRDAAATVRKETIQSLARHGLDDGVSLLRDADTEVRVEAIRAAGLLVVNGVATDLEKLLPSESEEIRQAAARALLLFGRPGPVVGYLRAHPDDFWVLRAPLGRSLRDADVSAVEEMLGSVDAELRAAAAGVLGHAGYKRSVPAIVRLLEDPIESVRRDAAMALAGLDDTSAVPALVLRLEDPDGDVRSEAIYALAALGAAEAAPEIRRRVHDWDERVGGEALEALKMLERGSSSPPEIRRLLRELSSHYASSRSKAADALGEIGDPRTRPALEAAASDEEAMVRSSACRALGLLELSESIPCLTAAMGDENSWVRAAAVAALGRLGERRALRAALEDADPYVRRAAAASVDRPEALAAIGRWAASEHTARRLDAAVVAGQIGAVERAIELRGLLSDAEPVVATEAAKSLSLLGDESGVGVLLDRETNLWGLNALRRPDAWRRLSEPLGKSGTYSPFQVRDRIEEIWGVRCEAPRCAEGVERVWLEPYTSSTLEAWSAIAELSDMIDAERFEFIVESDRIRIVTREEAKRFWSAWWKER